MAHANDTLADWQAMLLDRLARDPQIDLVGRMEGQGLARRSQIDVFLRAFLAVERLIVARQILPYDTLGARAVLSELPVTENAAAADIVLEFGERKLTAEQMADQDQGVWSLTFGGGLDATNVATGVTQRTAPGMIVQIVQRSAEVPEGHVVRAAQYHLKPGAILTGAFVEEKSVLLVLRALHDLAAGQTACAGSKPPLSAPQPQTVFGEIGYAASFVTALAAKLRDRWQARKGRAPDFWRLAVGSGDVVNLETRTATALPALSHTMADPFLFENDGKIWVFYEAMNADDGNGWIDVAELDGDTLKPAATALSCPYHLSFPFVFRDKDDIYMLPETQQSRRLEVWRAVEFPAKWERHATAFEGKYLADSTLWKAQDGQWWLLTNLSDHHSFQDHSSELYLFAVDGPELGSITPHPKNPVVIGSDIARNAGALIRENGRLFRPSQNNSYCYGYGLNLMEITTLDAVEFEETMVRRWTPDDRPNTLGIHHLSTSGDRFVFDWSGK
ncbi:hypothetical protein AB9F29_19400 [Falsihalocynthiibacter sp. S25ZX9]|uniref:glucosamine inositolphosphorylceramide transferase family protein n=1 Tax=Falsihalocynthiibacter sp. S25ZX9 TaxID=3240870 RepID=UPI00350F3227